MSITLLYDNKFQGKIDEILRELPNVFDIVYDILVMILIGQTMIECSAEYYKMQKRDSEA